MTRYEHKEYMRKWRKANPTYLRDWRKDHPEYHSKWQREHRTSTILRIRVYYKLLHLVSNPTEVKP